MHRWKLHLIKFHEVIHEYSLQCNCIHADLDLDHQQVHLFSNTDVRDQLIACNMALKVERLFHLNDPLYIVNADRGIGAPEVESTPWINVPYIQ